MKHQKNFWIINFFPSEGGGRGYYLCETLSFPCKEQLSIGTSGIHLNLTQFKRSKLIPGQCFVTGNYDGNNVDYVQNINDATSCQEECKKHIQCKFWTYNSNTKNCWRQTENAPQNLGTCDTCTRGPRYCAIGK